MKFIIAFILIIVLSFLSGLYFPWWTIAVVAFAVIALVPLRPLSAFCCGFGAIFLSWIVASYYMSTNNDHVLAHKVSLLILQTDNPFLLILATGVIGGLVAGFAALCGAYVRRRAA